MSRLAKCIVALTVVIAGLGIAASPAAAARPLPDSTSFTEMAKRYHCGPFFHGHKVRGQLVQITGKGATRWVHVGLPLLIPGPRAVTPCAK